MKSTLPLFLAIGTLFAGMNVNAQLTPGAPPDGESQAIRTFESKALKSCGNDTVKYTESKATAAIVQEVSLNTPVGEYPGVAQIYPAPQDITIHGICFYGYTNITASSVPRIYVKVYDGDSIPGALLALDSVDVAIGPAPTSYTDAQICVTFATPITVSSSYIVSVENPSNEPFVLYRGDDPTGGSEELSLVYYDDGSTNPWVKWYNQTTDPAFVGFNWDYDYFVEPIVSYDVEFVSDLEADTLCPLDEYCLMTDSVSPIYWNPIYSTDINTGPIADWGDGTVGTSDSVCNTYIIGGPYTVSYGIVMGGWTNACLVADTAIIEVEDPIASFTYSISNDTVTFTNTSTGASAYDWDFDGLGSSVAMDTIFVFPANGSYDIWLDIESGIGCDDADMQTITITVGVEEFGLPGVSLFPNPSQGQVTISNPSAEKLNMTILDLAGKMIYADVINGSSNLIDLNHLSGGQYIVHLSNNEGFRTEKIQLVK